MKPILRAVARIKRSTEHPYELTRLTFFLFVLLGAGFVVISTPSLFPSALISILLFFIFSPLVDALERRGIRRAFGILAAFLVCGLAIVLLMDWATPQITQEIETFQKNSETFSTTFAQRLNLQEQQLSKTLPFFKSAGLTQKFLHWLKESSLRIWNIIPQIASNLLLGVFLVPLLTFFLLNDTHRVRQAVLRLVPNRHFETVYSLMSRIMEEMGGYVSARIFEALLLGGMVTIGCLVFQVPYAVLLGIFAGATNAIPYLGPILGVIPAIAFAVLQPSIPNHLFWVLMIYFVANFIDMVLIFPLIVARIVNLHPVVVVISVLLGAHWFGIFGMILGVPVASILKILFQEVYSRIYNFNEYC